MNLRLAHPPTLAPPALATLVAPWADPVAVAAGLADRPWTFALLSDGGEDGRWSYVGAAPKRSLVLRAGMGRDGWSEAAALLGPCLARTVSDPAAPPFTGGLVGLAAYELGARSEPTAPQPRHPDWPDLALGLFLAVLAFDHRRRRVVAIGRGRDDLEAEAAARRALGWLAGRAEPARPSGRLAAGFAPLDSATDYARAVADVVEAIAAGEIFQANIARRWVSRLARSAHPFDLAAALATRSPAPFAAYLRLPNQALVSNSPERFVSVDASGRVDARPIKGTRPRGTTPEDDARLSAELLASEKDRAENLMIVDLMRNDLSRVCRPGSVEVPRLFDAKAYANVHHLVSTVTGELERGRTALELMAAAFPPGSITGAPKLQAMQVIARHEPPRGPFFGSVFWAGFDDALDSSVLIRTVGFVEEADGWRFEARAGAGIVADSDPRSEAEETETKIAALAAALTRLDRGRAT